ncbi:keratin, type I cytoskeletal 13-like [Sphaeramia orbicularis]|uniref:keratin, type I cytoskeletal 13-like n=1 Tax=Sphaeramia orbicularis TaxID=375764 RepID=UPI00117D1BED|nr:keratin, type I cytoskeletal 13-like [Sphaeramia orbicularis]
MGSSHSSDSHDINPDGSTVSGNVSIGSGGNISAHSAAPVLCCSRSTSVRPPTDVDKFSAQTLNTCLVDYLSTMRSLEDANAKLELKVRQWVESSGGSASRDYTACFQTISIIRSKIQTAIQLYGSMGDAQTADEHLKDKSEKEPAALQSLEADAAELKKILNQLAQTRST